MASEVKPIVLTDNESGEKYTLEFSRETIKWAEMHKFDIEEVAKYPMSKTPELFYYAFRMHHKNVAREKTDKIFNELGSATSAVIARLGELYAAPFDTLLGDEDEEVETKNARMTVEL